MRKKITVFTLLLLGLFFISVSASYLFFIYKKVYVAPVSPPPNATPTPTPDPMAPKNILLLGYGGAGHEGGTLTDTMIVAHLIPKEKKVFLISIPRDIWVPIPMKNGTQNFKINHAFSIGVDEKRFPEKLPQYTGIAGAGLLSREMVGLVTGLKIDNFVSVNFEGFKNIVNILGGINIYVPYSFKDEYYPIKGKEDDTCGLTEEQLTAIHATLSGQLLEQEFKCRFETIEFTKGLILMDGETSLKFVRSRHSDINGGDFGRSLRQQAFIVAVKNKLLSFGSFTKLIPVINSISKNTQTDIDIKSALNFVSSNFEIGDFEIKTVTLTTDNVLTDTISSDKQYILIPKAGEGNWDEIHKFISDAITQKPTVTQTSAITN